MATSGKRRLSDEFDFHPVRCEHKHALSDKVTLGELLDFLDWESSSFKNSYPYSDENVWYTLNLALDRTVLGTDDDYDDEDGILEWDYEKYLWDVGDTPYVDNGYIRIPVEILVMRHTKDYEGDAYGEVPSGHTGWAYAKPDADTGLTWKDVLDSAFGYFDDTDELAEINEQLTVYNFRWR